MRGRTLVDLREPAVSCLPADPERSSDIRPGPSRSTCLVADLITDHIAEHAINRGRASHHVKIPGRMKKLPQFCSDFFVGDVFLWSHVSSLP